MNTLILNRLAPCMAVAIVAWATTSSTVSGQTSSYVGDSPSIDGQIVAVDGVCVGCGQMGCNGSACGAGPVAGCNGAGCAACQGMGCGANGVFAPGCPSCGLGTGGAGGQGMDMTMRDRSYGRPDLFYNFYTQGYANRANAQMYLSPLPVPPNVGHTFYTYQPFMPHQMLYPHVDRFHRYYDGGRGTNRTRAVYWTSAHAKAQNFYWNFLRLPR